MAFTGRYQVLIAWSTAPFSVSPSWTDVTAWVRLDRPLELQRGRQDNIGQIQAGRLTLTADNSDGRFTAGRSSSPWYPNVKIGRRIQVNIPDEAGTLHTRFDGMITELPAQWEGGPGTVNLAVIQAADILSWLGRQDPLLSWTQQEMLADAPVGLWSLADSSSVTSATDQAGQGALPLQVVSQGDGTGAASAGSGAPLAEVQTSQVTAQQQAVQTTTFSNPGSVSWTAPLGTIVSTRVQCTGGGQAGTTGSGAGGTGGTGGEYAEEANLAVTAGSTYTGTVGAVGAPSGGSGGTTTFTGDSVTVTAHGGGTGLTSSNTIHFSGGAGGAGSSLPNKGGGGGSSGGFYQAGYAGSAGNSSISAGGAGAAVTGGGAGGAGDTGSAAGGQGSAPGGAGGGGNGTTSGGAGGAGQVIITCTYVPPSASSQNSSIPSWLFTPGSTLAARILSGALPQQVTAAAGFAAECWAAFAGVPAASVTTFTTTGSVSFTAPPGALTADVACWAGGQAGTTGSGAGGTGGTGGEYAEEASLQLTPGSAYTGTVGTAGAPSGGSGGDTTFTGDAVTVTAHGSGSGSSNTTHFNGGSGGAGSGSPNRGGGGGSSGGPYQAGNNGVAGNSSTSAGQGGAAVTSGGAGGSGTTLDPAPGSAPGGGGGGGNGTAAGASGAPGQITVTVQPSVSCLLTLVQPRGQNAIAVWVTTAGHLQLASTSGYGTRSPSWTTVDAGQVPSSAFHVAVSVAATTRVATLYVNGVSKGTLTLPAGASYAWVTVGGAYGGWLGGWNGSAGLLGVYPAALTSTRVGVHYTAGSTGFTGSSTGTMISKIASYVGLPSFYYTAPSGTADSSYGLGLVSYLDLKGQGPLAAMQAYEQAEGGVLSVNAPGKLTFADRASRYSAGAAGSAFVLSAGQYEPDTHYKSNDQYLTTEACFATVNIPGGYPVTNASAESDYGPYVQNSGSPASPQAAPFADATGTAYTYSPDDLMDAGNWATGVLGQPVTRIPSLTVDLLTQPASEFSVASFYGLDIGSAVQLTGLPSQAPDSSGQPLAAYGVIEGVNETLDLGHHDVQLYTSPLAQEAAWIPGDALLGVLGSTNTVGRSRSPSALGAPYPVPTFGATLNRTGSAGAQDWRGLTVNTQAKLTPPLLIAQQASAQTLVTAAGQAVSFDTLAADTAGGMGTVTTYTIPSGYGGWWWCSAVVQAATGNASLGGLAVWFAVTLSGVAGQWHARSLPYLSSAPYIAAGISGKIGPFSAGDTIQVIAAWSGSAATLPLGTADGGSMLTLMWEGST